MSDEWTPTEELDYSEPAQLPPQDEQARDRLNWHLKMAARHTRLMDEEAAPFQAEIDRLTARLEELKEKHQRAISWHQEPVRQYHLALLREQGAEAPRTLNLPYGSSRLRVPKKPAVDFTEDGYTEALEWVKEHHPDHLKVTLLKSAVQSLGSPVSAEPGAAVVDPLTGEIIPGVQAHVPEPSWSCTTEGDPQ